MVLEVDNFDLKGILLSGACFRVTVEKDGSFTNILSDRVINIKQVDNKLFIKSSKNDNLEKAIRYYFDLDRDYNLINKQLINNDKSLSNMISKCNGYRILNQDKFETSISYIISQNNRVDRISKIVNKISEKYGKKIIFEEKIYYLFPTYEEIKDISLEELRNLGLGFRDKYIRNYLDNYNNLLNIDKLSTKDALKELMNIKGIGLKVASCILLFAYQRLDVYPIDTWVKKYMIDNYNIKDNMKEIEKFTHDRFKEYSGLVIQYMFHSKRNN